MGTEAELIAEITVTLDKIRDKTTELQNSINSGLAGLSSWAGWVAARIVDAWNWFCQQADRFWSWITNTTSHMGSPSSLSQAADSWSSGVGGPVSSQVQAADAGSLLVDDTWTGAAASQYKQVYPQQKEALRAVKATFVDGLAGALDLVQKGIIAFWGMLAGALAALVIGLPGVIASSTTVFGLPAAPLIAAGAVGVATAACWGGGEILKACCASADTTLQGKLHDDTSYLGGRWPSGATG